MKITFFFPAYNDEKTVAELTNLSDSILRKYCDDYEIIIVHDASPDKTGEIADELTKNNPKVKVIHHKENKGYAQAILSGINNSKFDWILFTDGDMQFDINELPKFLKYVNSADLILGYKIKRADPWHRIFFSRIYNVLIRLLLGLKVRDMNCAFKLMKKEIFKDFVPSYDYREAFVLVEAFYKAKKKGFKFKEVPVHHYQRKFGKSQCFNLRMILRYSFYILRGLLYSNIFKKW